jgi:hypothetical protein
MRRRGWGHETPRNGLRARLLALTVDRSPWWDWGHKVMILVGDNSIGNWAEPGLETWWYRTTRVPTKLSPYPKTKIELVRSYDEFTARTGHLGHPDEVYDAGWEAINPSQDGELQLGHQYWGGRFHGMPLGELRLLHRYLRRWRRRNWWGLRSWLYSWALHAAVHRRRPFACHATPAKGSGGYDHWYCERPRRHFGSHRFANYTWVGNGPVHYRSQEVRA